MIQIPSADPGVTIGTVALAGQRQIATFFASGGKVIDDLSDITTSDGKPLFRSTNSGVAAGGRQLHRPDPVPWPRSPRTRQATC